MGVSPNPTHILGRSGIGNWLLRCLALLTLLLSSFVSAQEPARLRVGLDANYPPFEWVDSSGQSQGYTVEMFRAVAKSQNLDFEFHPMAWLELRAAFERGDIDVMTGMASSERRMKTIAFSVPHSTSLFNILVRVGETRIRSERDLAGMRILAEEGDILFEYLGAQGLNVQGTGSPEDAIRRLSKGDADCAVVPRLTWLRSEKVGEFHNLRSVPSEIFPTKYCFAVRKGHEALLAKLNKGLYLAQQNGTLGALHDHYLGSLEAVDLPLKAALRRAFPTALTGVLGLGMVVVLVWSLSLRRAVRLKTATLEATIVELEGALAEVKQLSGLIPMCAGCKKIRDDGGYWEAVEAYLSRHLEAQFTHGLCPDCVNAYFPGFHKANQNKSEPPTSA